MSDGTAGSLTPYFATGPLPGTRGRLLLATFHFPPSIAVGGLRWQKMARVASERGWELDVVALDPAALDRQDRSRFEDLPPGVRVFGVRVPWSLADSVEAPLAWVHAMARRLRQPSGQGWNGAAGGGDRAGTEIVAGSVPVSDIHFDPVVPRHWARALNTWIWVSRERAWARRAARLARRLVSDRGGYAAMISSGPPHMIHAAISPVCRRHGIPHAIDMRDPWSLQQRLTEGVASPVYFSMSGRAERRALAGAALLVCNTEGFLEAMRVAYPSHPPRRITVMNGWDPETTPDPPARSRFIIAFAGSIYLDRDPRHLFEAAREVIERLGLSPEDISLEFMGSVQAYGSKSLGSIAESVGIRDFVQMHPTGSRAEVLRFLSRASVLVSLPQDSDLAIPSKVFEYMLFPAWILALAEPSSATGTALRGTTAAVVDPGDVGGIAERLERWYEEFRKGVLPSALAGDERFSRRRQAEILLDALEAIVSPTSRSR